MSRAPAPRKNAAVLVFEGASQKLAVFIAEAGRILLETPLAPVPFAHPALAGLLDDDDGAIPVFDLGAFIDGTDPPAHVPDARIAIFATDKGPVGLRMDVLVGARDEYRFITNADENAQLHAALPERLRVTVTGFAESALGAFAFFSPDAFLHALDLGVASRPGGPGGAAPTSG